MAATETSLKKLGIRVGILTSILMIAYFILMRVLNLVHIPELRYFNFVILFVGLFYAYWNYSRSNENILYLPGLGLGALTTASSIMPFAAFLFIYFNHLEPNLLELLKNNTTISFADYMTPLSVAGAIVMEGMSAGLIISFILMQYYKSRTGKVTNELS